MNQVLRDLLNTKRKLALAINREDFSHKNQKFIRRGGSDIFNNLAQNIDCSDIFKNFAQNIDCGNTLESPR